MSQNTKEIEKRVRAISNFSDRSFVYDLLLAYGKPQSSISRLQSGTYNLSKDPTEICWKNNLLFKHLESESSGDLLLAIDGLSHDKEKLRHNPRFIIVTNFRQLLAVNMRDNSRLDIPIDKIAKHYSFFLPWAGMEKSALTIENEADVKAAERMAILYDEIIHHNPHFTHDTSLIHSLNIFFSRLLFCFFAEDTSIFPKKSFTDGVKEYTLPDGSDLDDFLHRLFQILDMDDNDKFRDDLPIHLVVFPYVNGKLFEKKLDIPKFSAKARRLLIECGDLNWSHINPDIFGSMIQAVVHPGERASLGMHYTSVVNITKVINPLFLEELNEEFEKLKDNKEKLWKLLNRIYTIKIFDPACGSGNFLIISYKELRRLELKILQQITGGEIPNLPSQIKLENFYGIEIDDFAHEVAVLSLWLAKHQMNLEFDKLFGTNSKLIPLKDVGSIVCGNAARLDWNDVCPNLLHFTMNASHQPIQNKLIEDELIQEKLIDDSELEQKVYDEIYVIGNPPYEGARKQNAVQKDDMASYFEGKLASFKNLDYIAIWIAKGADYIHNNPKSQYAFVSTNSICQGEQVGLLWPYIFNKNLEIGFAYTSFKWANNAKHNAGVTCVIIGVRNISNNSKYIFTDSVKTNSTNINAYLAISNSNVIVLKRTTPLSALPVMSFGNMPNDGGYFTLSATEKNNLVEANSNISYYIRRFMGAYEYINGVERWTIWVEKEDFEKALKISFLQNIADKVKSYRSKSIRETTRNLADNPLQYGEIRYKSTNSIIIPSVSSERREYIPIGYLDKNTIISNAANAIYDAELYIFGLISSRLHMTWVRAVAGRLKTDIRYSSAIVYNNFPVPPLSTKQKDAIADHVKEVLSARENHSEMTLAQMYDPDHMPADLRMAHNGLDEIVERCYRTKLFTSDEERLSYLFKEYEKMIAMEKESQ